MRVLLDTHTFLWFIADAPELAEEARRVIEAADNQPLLSVGSIWEMAIKISLGRLELARPFDELVGDQLAVNQIELLPITIAHVNALTSLPFHHRDPFDRLLVAQATVERVPIVSRDEALDAYGVNRVGAARPHTLNGDEGPTSPAPPDSTA